MFNDLIFNYAIDHNIELKDGDTVQEVHKKIVENNPKLHTIEQHQKYAKELMCNLYNNYDKDFKALMVFARNPIIYTQSYNGFDEVYLYEHIHRAMGHSTQAFCELNNINEDFDKKILEHEFKHLWGERIGFLPIYDPEYKSIELITLMKIIKRHGFDTNFIKVLEEDLKYSLKKLGDKYFQKKDLTQKDNIVLLYEVICVTYSQYPFAKDMYSYYDGYGHVVCEHTNIIQNDLSLYYEITDGGI